MDEFRQGGLSQGGASVGAIASPFARRSLDEALGFAVGLRSARSNADDVTQAKGSEMGGKEFGLIARAVVVQEALGLGPWALMPRDAKQAGAACRKAKALWALSSGKTFAKAMREASSMAM